MLWSGTGASYCTAEKLNQASDPGHCTSYVNGVCVACESYSTTKALAAYKAKQAAAGQRLPAAVLPSSQDRSAGTAENIPGWYRLASYAGAASGVFHGYKRHRGSIGWAIGWGLLGGILPVITIPLSLAQGYGKPRGR